MEVKNGRGFVYSLQYHVVWCVKYRRKILDEEIEKDLFNILRDYAKDHKFGILEMNTNKDHIQLELKQKLWNPSYFIATVSENTEEQIRNYIRSQKEK